ncbi:MAG: prepilin-type N-terminal cleavage/methylation domain-containing protein [Candidatus Omnitrophica bacterium]|nr:prepilin-type N-terminal cleavage/methylation domain-containing protein [Candidatus Omnitrophota bacterium]MCA9418791.1 prepilin-type N-terminal cleavage/methylation domain-containing protein [Candidatus Omnitrophota bacterium]MCA9427510.1 prepilin-type N-terminal cleavage/methylation domain-containing protein [Candidatus Omnitrophota bacterium]MCA9433147.1 prepilin-type N-terminal cleavage/methylation domain-containing protein [Candidatus Omnitrophota bacterium]MCA9448033.1 prepilin-type N-
MVRKPSRGRRAFTLIELLIVIAIILILVAIALPNFLEAQMRAKVVRANADLKSLVTALESYQIEFRQYLDLWQARNWGPRYDPNSITSHRLLPLTTPIKFIASIPPEAFDLSREIPGFQADTYAYGSRVSYDKEGIFWRDYFDRKLKYQYSIRSIGPDRASNIIEPIFPDLILPYSPTNGTKSRGDINFWGP